MKFSKCGMTTTRKIAFAIPLIVIIALGVYVALGLRSGLQSTSSSSSTGAVSTGGEAMQPNSILDMFGNFSQMVITTHYVNLVAEEDIATHFSYAVVGRAVVNSTNYYKVEFKDLDANKSVITWFNQQGLVDRVDVLGDKNYTGSNAPLYAQAFITAFSLIPNYSYNTTLLSGLQKMTESAQSIGPTQMNVITYGLTSPTSTYSNYTIKIATVPGANAKLAVYWYEESPDTSNTLLEVTSVTRA